MTHKIENGNWKWNFAAGFVPFTAGFVTIITTLLSKSNGEASWNLILMQLDFSYHDMVAVSANSGDFFDLILSVSGVNIVVGENTLYKIDPKSWKIVDGKLYLNYDRETQEAWEANLEERIKKAEAYWPAVLYIDDN